MDAPKIIVAAGAAAAGISASINEAISVSAAAFTIVGSAWAIFRGRRKRGTPPNMPPKLPLHRTSKEDYARMLAEWETFRVRNEQYIEDQRGHD